MINIRGHNTRRPSITLFPSCGAAGGGVCYFHAWECHGWALRRLFAESIYLRLTLFCVHADTIRTVFLKEVHIPLPTVSTDIRGCNAIVRSGASGPDFGHRDAHRAARLSHPVVSPHCLSPLSPPAVSLRCLSLLCLPAVSSCCLSPLCLPAVSPCCFSPQWSVLSHVLEQPVLVRCFDVHLELLELAFLLHDVPVLLEIMLVRWYLVLAGPVLELSHGSTLKLCPLDW